MGAAQSDEGRARLVLEGSEWEGVGTELNRNGVSWVAPRTSLRFIESGGDSSSSFEVRQTHGGAERVAADGRVEQRTRTAAQLAWSLETQPGKRFFYRGELRAGRTLDCASLEGRWGTQRDCDGSATLSGNFMLDLARVGAAPAAAVAEEDARVRAAELREAARLRQTLRADAAVFRALALLGFAAALFASAATVDWPAAWLLVLAKAAALFVDVAVPVVCDPPSSSSQPQQQQQQQQQPLPRWETLWRSANLPVVLFRNALAGTAHRAAAAGAAIALLQALAVFGVLLGEVLSAWTARSRRMQQMQQTAQPLGAYALVRQPESLALAVGFLSAGVLLGSPLPGALLAVAMLARAALLDAHNARNDAAHNASIRAVPWLVIPRIW